MVIEVRGFAPLLQVFGVRTCESAIQWPADRELPPRRLHFQVVAERCHSEGGAAGNRRWRSGPGRRPKNL